MDAFYILSFFFFFSPCNATMNSCQCGEKCVQVEKGLNIYSRLWCHHHTVLHGVVIKVLIFVGQHRDQAMTDQSRKKIKSRKKKVSSERDIKGGIVCCKCDSKEGRNEKKETE